MKCHYMQCNCEYLNEIGFKIISRRYGIISRIDRSDWKEILLENGYLIDADIYRRVFSNDRYTLGSQLFRKKLFTSSDKSSNDNYIKDNYPDNRLKYNTGYK